LEPFSTACCKYKTTLSHNKETVFSSNYNTVLIYECIIYHHSLPSSTTTHLTVPHPGCTKLELVDKFCYLGDMLSVDGDADAAVEARIRTGWNKFRQLVLLLTNKDVSLIMRGRMYSSCV